MESGQLVLVVCVSCNRRWRRHEHATHTEEPSSRVRGAQTRRSPAIRIQQRSSLTTHCSLRDVLCGLRSAMSVRAARRTSRSDWLPNPFAPPPLARFRDLRDLFSPLPSSPELPVAPHPALPDIHRHSLPKTPQAPLALPSLATAPYYSLPAHLIALWRTRLAAPSLDAPLSYLDPAHPRFSLRDSHLASLLLPPNWVYPQWRIRGYPDSHSHASINILLVNAYCRPDQQKAQNNRNNNQNDTNWKQEACILFTTRPNTMSSYAGHVCFPGGKFDRSCDVANIDAARRELHEELNFGNGESPPAPYSMSSSSSSTSTMGEINEARSSNEANDDIASQRKSGIEIDYLGEMPAMADRFRRSEIHPFVAVIRQPQPDSPDFDPSKVVYVGDNPHLINSPQEVQRVFCVPLRELVHSDSYVFENFREDSPALGPVWYVCGERIWGLTALSLWWFMYLVVSPGGVVMIQPDGRRELPTPARTVHNLYPQPPNTASNVPATNEQAENRVLGNEMEQNGIEKDVNTAIVKFDNESDTTPLPVSSSPLPTQTSVNTTQTPMDTMVMSPPNSRSKL